MQRENDLSEHTKMLIPLTLGQVVLVQNQSGNNPLRWDKSGQIVEVLPYDQYRVKMDGTGRSSLRNRKFLRAITPFSDTTTNTPPTPIQVTTEDNPEIPPNQPSTVENNNVTQTSPTPPDIRRSSRIHKIPVHLQDFSINSYSLDNRLKELTGREA